ncbi:GvpT/GvpP family gas vesicle accessory protein [Paenibacillus xerothermodurans]|uniref:Uncharacterized protein n=1 Tax=Paenibacillus xerothermodurans TaxID=1977292 RepID=A0A2W1NXZ1_PAEXE|nr:GvpT/GvpP family gas vesicle accessory protein [Paenibacillus xerothermodurans]PZE19708.1 hypothetical protein CBW46_017415 [Paenibacillus xerothermodurans]
MEKAQELQNQTEVTENNQGSMSSAVTLSIAGGLIGAAAGYLATSENRKKVMAKIGTRKLKSAGLGLGQSLKDKSVKTVESLKNSAGKVFNKKADVSLEGYSNEQEQSPGNETSLSVVNGDKPEKNNEREQSGEQKNDNVQKENRETNSVDARLDRLEAMIAQLIHEKNGENQKKHQGNELSRAPESEDNSQGEGEENEVDGEDSGEDHSNEKSSNDRSASQSIAAAKEKENSDEESDGSYLK